ncbi:hypothetical protein [Desulforamulus ferrireducens]|uniref:Uncharacterized protein n=1 Tax=Desulforamulus ferrireducens TaxID=1833852 RepID=A0A1S6IYR8_9FIRM|nr:hypothetical protein [Desulforamulus ferrireducens]AQS59917.1 hypothetical protein B0537_13015 [Desulforamulus ferrireducens]
MWRIGLIIITLGVFVLIVGLGVNTAIQQFNQIVLPERPLKLYEVRESTPGVIYVELVGETLCFDVGELKQQAEINTAMALAKWQELKDSPQLQQMATKVKEKWQTLMEKEEVRAVNQWVKERI